MANIYQSFLLCFLGGIIQHHCSAGSVDHAVQIVGYDMAGTECEITIRICNDFLA